MGACCSGITPNIGEEYIDKVFKSKHFFLKDLNINQIKNIFGLPVPRSNCIINVSGQYAHLQGIGASRLDENILQVTVGLTFNETWFFKRRIN